MTGERYPTFGIVTPSFNQGEFIGETIESVLSQEGPFFVDYRIVDGASTDRSVSVIRRYADLVAGGEWKVRCAGITFSWVSEKDRGQTHAINKGFAGSRADIFSWINSDDAYHEGAFSKVVTWFSAHPRCDLVYGDGEVIDEKGAVQWVWLSRRFDLNLLKSYHFLWNDFPNYILQQATFWRRRVMDRIGFLDESLHYAMDIEYWIRAGERGCVLEHLPQRLGKFRMIQNTKSLSSPTVFWPESLEIFRRYHGAEKMLPFLTYYLYNEGIHGGWDVDHLLARCRHILNTWKGFPESEVALLGKLTEKAYHRALLRLAVRALLEERRDKAEELYALGLRGRAWRAAHPLALLFVLGKALGPEICSRIRMWRHRLIQGYRSRRYLSRYRKGEDRA